MHEPIITAKGTKLPLMDIKGKPYLQVAYRLVWFREDHPDWSIQTTFIEINTEKQYCIAKATISEPTILNDGGEIKQRVIATAHKVETKIGFSDYLEKAETGAIGRALAMCGYGTQFEPGLDEKDRIVDSPMGRVSKTPEEVKASIKELMEKRNAKT